MDYTKKVAHVSLCAGYGGIDLGLKRAIPNLRTVAFSEIEAFACANLVAKMEAGLLDPAPIWTDLKTFPWAAFRGKVDILSGGYPCQPFSAAGKRLGKDDPRHLWPWIADGIAAMQPRACFFENVEGHISLGLSTVISDLEELGYKVSWGIFSASECLDASGRTAPHQRKRVFILADKQREGLERPARKSIQGDCCGFAFNGRNAWPSRPGEQQYGWEPPRVVGNTASGARLRGTSGCEGYAAQPDETSGHGQTESPLGRDADGPSGGVGDAIVYASDCYACELCGEPVCPRCNIHYAECGCPGPNSSDE